MLLRQYFAPFRVHILIYVRLHLESHLANYLHTHNLYAHVCVCVKSYNEADATKTQIQTQYKLHKHEPQIRVYELKLSRAECDAMI